MTLQSALIDTSGEKIVHVPANSPLKISTNPPLGYKSDSTSIKYISCIAKIDQTCSISFFRKTQNLVDIVEEEKRATLFYRIQNNSIKSASHSLDLIQLYNILLLYLALKYLLLSHILQYCNFSQCYCKCCLIMLQP